MEYKRYKWVLIIFKLNDRDGLESEYSSIVLFSICRSLVSMWIQRRSHYIICLITSSSFEYYVVTSIWSDIMSRECGRHTFRTFKFLETFLKLECPQSSSVFNFNFFPVIFFTRLLKADIFSSPLP